MISMVSGISKFSTWPKKTAIITNLEYAEEWRKIKGKEERKKQKQAIKTKKFTREKINYQAFENSESEIEVESESES